MAHAGRVNRGLEEDALGEAVGGEQVARRYPSFERHLHVDFGITVGQH